MAESYLLPSLPDSIGLLKIGPSFLLELPDTVVDKTPKIYGFEMEADLAGPSFLYLFSDLAKPGETAGRCVAP
jgi:hypothetical protein